MSRSGSGGTCSNPRWKTVTGPHSLTPSARTLEPATGRDAWRSPESSGARRVLAAAILSRPSTRGFGPRVGLAYSIDPKTVVRGGYGIFFEQNFYPGWGGGIATDGFNGTASFSSSLGGMQPAFLLQNGFPQNFTPPPFINSSYLNGQSSPNYRPFDANNLPRAQQWNLTVEHQFTDNFYISAGYVGNHGLRLTSYLDPINALDPKYLSLGSKLYDQFQPGQTTLDGVPIPYPGWVEQMKGCTPNVAQALVPYPQFCNNIYGGNENIGASTYNALQVKVEKRMSRGFWL